MSSDDQSPDRTRREVLQGAPASLLVFGLGDDASGLFDGLFGDDDEPTQRAVAVGYPDDRSAVDPEVVSLFIAYNGQMYKPDGDGSWTKLQYKLRHIKNVGVSGILADKLSNRPSAGQADRLFVDTGGPDLYHDDGSSWTQVNSSGASLTDSGSDNVDGGDQYQLPNAEDSIDLQSSGDIENAATIDIDGGKDVPGIPNSSSSPTYSLGGGWRQPSTDRPVQLVFQTKVDTDGTTSAWAFLEVDESGGTTSDYDVRLAFADADVGAHIVSTSLSVIIPAGAQYRAVNSSNPNNNNALERHREFIL